MTKAPPRGPQIMDLKLCTTEFNKDGQWACSFRTVLLHMDIVFKVPISEDLTPHKKKRGLHSAAFMDPSCAFEPRPQTCLRKKHWGRRILGGCHLQIEEEHGTGGPSSLCVPQGTSPPPVPAGGRRRVRFFLFFSLLSERNAEWLKMIFSKALLHGTGRKQIWMESLSYSPANWTQGCQTETGVNAVARHL